MSRYLLLVFILVNFVRHLKSCGPYYYDYDDEEPIKKPGPNATAFERNENQAWRGWKPSAQTKNQWRNWMTEYNKKYANRNKGFDKTKHGNLTERAPGSGWPEGWKDLGDPNTGDNPPPWAYVPKNIGKPALCSQRPLKGNCKQRLNRWGYNPFTDNCESYIYSGCRGSENNFMNKKACEQKCMQRAPSRCDSSPHIYADDVFPAEGPG